MSLSLDGLVSGLKTTEVIKALMDVHAIPRSLLKAKMDDKNGIVSQLQTLNTSIQNLATAAEKAASRDGLARFTTSSSSPTVTVATRTGVPLAEIAKAHPECSIGSYPFWSETGPDTNIVIRSRDPERLMLATAAVQAMVEAERERSRI